MRTNTRRVFGLLAIAAVALASGCSGGSGGGGGGGTGGGIGTGPGSVTISGNVTYYDGQPVDYAKVFVGGVDTVLADRTGHYQLTIVVSVDSVRVVASDGYAPGRTYSEFCAGSTMVGLTARSVIANIVTNICVPL